MKKLKLAVATLTLSAVSSLAVAANPGAYVGLGLGGSHLSTQNPNVNFTNGSFSHSQGGLGGKLFAGYNFNQYLGLEAGFADFAQSKYSYTKTGVGSGTKKYNMYTLDLVGKAYLPIQQSGVNLYALGGAALVNSKVQVNQTGNVFTTSGSSSTTTRKVRPIVGVGTSYDINQNVTTSLEYSHIQGTGNVKSSSSAIPNADMLTLNVSYNFD